MNEIIKMPAEYYLYKLQHNDYFSLSRFGDGEVICMFPCNLKENCDGNIFYPELKEPMMNIFKNNYNYYHCFLDCTFHINGDLFKSFINKTCPDMKFYDGEIWQELSFSGRIKELTSILKNACFVGGNHLRNVIHIKGISDIGFIEIPSKNSFLEFDDIKYNILQMFNLGYRTFCFSAGYTTKILIDSLFPEIGDKCFMIDFGSLFDPYCGILSRDGMVVRGNDYFKQFI